MSALIDVLQVLKWPDWWVVDPRIEVETVEMFHGCFVVRIGGCFEGCASDIEVDELVSGGPTH